jgi:hypothetical protein
LDIFKSAFVRARPSGLVADHPQTGKWAPSGGESGRHRNPLKSDHHGGTQDSESAKCPAPRCQVCLLSWFQHACFPLSARLRGSSSVSIPAPCPLTQHLFHFCLLWFTQGPDSARLGPIFRYPHLVNTAGSSRGFALRSRSLFMPRFHGTVLTSRSFPPVARVR